MSISFQTNIASMLAAVNLNNNNNFQTSTIEALTSGYRINHSGDDAAGLAVANGYAASIAELTQGVLNANDGVNTLQIVDGGLSNISTMLNRMQTLATESASSTFTGNRATLNEEYQTLIGEINREAGNIGLGTSNSSNAVQLSVYIGGGASSTSGSAVNIDLSNGFVDAAALGLAGSSVSGTSAVTVGSVVAAPIANAATESFTVNTGSGSQTFTITGTGDTVQNQLSELNADLNPLGIQATIDSTGKLAFSSNSAFDIKVTNAGLAADGDTNINTALYNNSLTYDTGHASTYTVAEGSGSPVTVLLAAGLTDAQAVASINSQLSAAGISDLQAVQTSTAGTYSLQGLQNFTAAVGNANGGTASVGASTTAAQNASGALSAINAVTAAVQLLGNVQGVVGAGENDLNYAIGLANSQITNFSAAESGIRDADVAHEAANLTKAQVLEQASVAAMAQANSAPQVILSLLKSA